MLERLRGTRDDDGFTLIELLIVIVILGILAAIVVFAVGSTGKNASAAACNADAKSVETALEAVKAQTGAYPGALGGQTAADWNALTGGGGGGATYLRSQPGTTHYTIWYDGSGNVLIGAKAAADSTGALDFDKTPTACTTNAS